MFLSDEDVYKALEQKLRRPVNLGIWDYLKDKYYVAEVLENKEYDIEDLLDEYLTLEELAGDTLRSHTDKRKEHAPAGQTGHLLTLSVILAAQIGRLPEVKAFRKEVLQNNLLSLEEVKDWIETINQKEEESRGSSWTFSVTVNESDFKTAKRVASATLLEEGIQPGSALARPVLEFQSTAEFVESVVGYNTQGVLGRLQRLAKHIVRYHAPAWTEALATTFILTDLTPIIPRIRYRTDLSLHGGPCWLTMSLDVRITPEQLAKDYRKIRRRLMGKRRAKPLSKKIQAVARFAGRHKTEQCTWREVMDLWNKQYPDWIYNDYKRFCRDATRATKAIMDPGLESIGVLNT